MPFDSNGHLIDLKPDARDRHPTAQKWSEKASPDRPRMSDSLTNQIVFHGFSSNIDSFPVPYKDRWKGKFVWFRNNIHSTNSTKLHWTERRPVVKRLMSRSTFLNYRQTMVAVSPNAGSAPSIGSKVIRIRAWDGFVWSKKGSSDPRSDAKSDANCVQSEADRTPAGVKRQATFLVKRP